MSSVPPAIVQYCNTQDLVRLLNLQQSSTDPNKYLVWQIPTSVDILNTFVRYSNEQTTATWGDLTQSSLLPLARQYAVFIAALNMIETMTVNWVISGLPVTIGDVSINRLQAMQAATVEVKERFKEEIGILYVKLSEISFPNNYQSPSPYVDFGGSPYWS